MATYKGFAMKKIGEVDWVEKEIPKVGHKDALVKPIAVSPCSSDIHTVYEGAIGEKSDRILGHEAVGIIEEVGDEVKDFKVGDKVVVPCVSPDWEDEAIQRGWPGQSGGLIGSWQYSNTKDGSFAEYVHVSQADANLAKIPDEVTTEQALMLADMVPTGFEGARRADIEIGSTVCVVGIGPVGLCAVAGAKLLGAARIFAVGTRPNCIEVAKKYGATDIISYKEGPIEEQILKLTDGKGVDSIIIAGGRVDVFGQAIKMAKPGATISNVNYLSGADTVPLPVFEWGNGMSNIDIKTCMCKPGRLFYERLLDLIKYGRIDPSLLLTHKFHGMDKIPEALALMKDKPRDLIKPIVYFD